MEKNKELVLILKKYSSLMEQFIDNLQHYGLSDEELSSLSMARLERFEEESKKVRAAFEKCIDQRSEGNKRKVI